MAKIAPRNSAEKAAKALKPESSLEDTYIHLVPFIQQSVSRYLTERNIPEKSVDPETLESLHTTATELLAKHAKNKAVVGLNTRFKRALSNELDKILPSITKPQKTIPTGLNKTTNPLSQIHPQENAEIADAAQTAAKKLLQLPKNYSALAAKRFGWHAPAITLEEAGRSLEKPVTRERARQMEEKITAAIHSKKVLRKLPGTLAYAIARNAQIEKQLKLGGTWVPPNLGRGEKRKTFKTIAGKKDELKTAKKEIADAIWQHPLYALFHEKIAQELEATQKASQQKRGNT